MSTSSLKHAVTLARTLSFTKAADELGLTQSALSRSIQALENRVGMRLFDRERGGGVHLTVGGRRLTERAGPLLREFDELMDMLDRSARAEEGEVVFGAAPIPAKALVLPMLQEAFASRPELRSSIVIRTADTLIDMVAKGQIEFCICPEMKWRESNVLNGEPLGWFPLNFVVRNGHPLLAAGLSEDGWDFPWIVSGAFEAEQASPATPHFLMSKPPHIVTEDIETLAKLTESTDAVWLTTPFAAADRIRDGRLIALPRPELPHQWRMRIMFYGRSRRTLSPSALWMKAQFQDQVRALTAAMN